MCAYSSACVCVFEYLRGACMQLVRALKLFVSTTVVSALALFSV